MVIINFLPWRERSRSKRKRLLVVIFIVQLVVILMLLMVTCFNMQSRICNLHARVKLLVDHHQLLVLKTLGHEKLRRDYNYYLKQVDFVNQSIKRKHFMLFIYQTMLAEARNNVRFTVMNVKENSLLINGHCAAEHELQTLFHVFSRHNLIKNVSLKRKHSSLKAPNMIGFDLIISRRLLPGMD